MSFKLKHGKFYLHRTMNCTTYSPFSFHKSTKVDLVLKYYNVIFVALKQLKAADKMLSHDQQLFELQTALLILSRCFGNKILDLSLKPGQVGKTGHPLMKSLGTPRNAVVA